MSGQSPVELVGTEKRFRTRVWTAVLTFAILALGSSSWKTLTAVRRSAAEESARDYSDILELREKNARLTTSQASAIPASRQSPIAVSEPGLATSRAEALSVLTELTGRGYLATPHPVVFMRALTQANAVAAMRMSNGIDTGSKAAAQPAYMLDAAGSFGPGFAEFFGLTLEEDATLQSRLSEWKEEMQRAIIANAIVQRWNDGSVMLEVSPVPNADAMRERFSATLLASLGAERFRALKTLNSWQFPVEDGPLSAAITGNSNFFGEALATYTVRRTAAALDVSYKFQWPSGSGSGVGRIPLANGSLREHAIKAHGPVMQLLPADF